MRKLAIACCALLLCSLPGLAQTLVQSNSASTGSTSPGTLAFTSNNTAGNLIIVVARVSGGTSSVPTDLRNTYQTAVANQQLGIGGSYLSVYYAENIAAGANTVSVVFTGGIAMRLAIFEYSGLATSGSLDRIAGNSGSSTNTGTSGNVTTTAANELAFGAVGVDVLQNFAAGTNWRLEQCQNTCGAGYLATEDQPLSSTQTVASTWGTFSGSPFWSAIIATFKKAPSAATSTISGTISPSGSGAGATITLTQGSATIATATADASGNYSFAGLANGTYTVTPSKSGFSFSPASQPVTVSSVNVTGVNFSTVTYSLSGTISGAGGNGATVSLSGAASATVTANAAGTYTFTAWPTVPTP